MRGIVTFTTDFGLQDPFVAVMKGQVLRRNRELQLVDITHDIAPYQPAEAGFWLQRAARYFPEGTVHVAVVDPGVGTARALIAVQSEGQLFLAPDNGLLAGIGARPGAVTRRIAAATLATIDATAQGSTFQGRDLLAPIAAELASGSLDFEALGDICRPLATLPPTPVTTVGDQLVGQIVTVDRFGNLFSNIDDGHISRSRPWVVIIRGHELRRVGAYGEAATGELVALVNSWGIVEVAEVAGSAARRLDVGRGEPVTLRYQQGG